MLQRRGAEAHASWCLSFNRHYLYGTMFSGARWQPSAVDFDNVCDELGESLIPLSPYEVLFILGKVMSRVDGRRSRGCCSHVGDVSRGECKSETWNGQIGTRRSRKVGNGSSHAEVLT